jgi:hypothetical protein
MQVQGKPREVFRADLRINTWLMLTLLKEGVSLPLNSFEDRDFRERAATVVSEGRVHSLLEAARQRLLPLERFAWITEDERQLKWLSAYIEAQLKFRLYPIPVSLFGRDLVLASLDFIDCDLIDKAQIIEKMRFSWNEHVKADSIYKWFKGEAEALRCAFAWEWLLEKKGAATYGRDRISSYADVLIFFDSLRDDIAQKKLDIGAIKSRWNQRRYREKLVGKQQYNLLLSDKAVVELDKMATKYGVSRPQIIEALIEYEAKKGLYLPEKIKMITWG